jgi:hypothetical protein
MDAVKGGAVSALTVQTMLPFFEGVGLGAPASEFFLRGGNLGLRGRAR